MEVEEDKGLLVRQWRESEVLALVSAWDEVGAQHKAESRATFELISGRLRRLSVMRSWRECEAKCRSLGLQGGRPDAAAADYSQAADARPKEGWQEEVEGVGNQRRIYPSSVTIPMQEGVKTVMHPAAHYTPTVAEEGGRHWTDDEVRALLCIWADNHIRQRLKSSVRNKSIFQEMARQMQKSFGVVRNWKQCRTKYKNLKYDYKTAKSAHAVGGSGAGSPGKYMKFFDEVEAILLDRGLDNGTMTMQTRLYSGETGAGQLQMPAEHTEPLTVSEDDNSDEYDIDGDIEGKWRSSDGHPTLADSSGSDQFLVVTVADTGRNWTDQEVRALIQVWSDERICAQLESSTRKRDIFVQISNRLMQQGIERDWKQCHTKYKNLKYLYRALKRGKIDEADPKRLMRFYDEVDAIMNHRTNGSPDAIKAADSRDPSILIEVDECEENDNVKIHMAQTDTNMLGATKETTCGSDSVPLVTQDGLTKTDHGRIHTGKEHPLDQYHKHKSASETKVDKEDIYVAKRGMKRKSVDQDIILQAPFKRQTGLADGGEIQTHCKEEQDPIPIIKINSVCSMASTNASQQRQVVSADPV